MGLSDIVSVTISAATVNVTQQGFGIPLILGTPSWVTDRIRFYSDIVGVAVDFATTRPEYKAAAAMFSQTPRPSSIAIGRLALKPTQKFTITPTVTDSATYTVVINGTSCSFTAGTSTTATLICDGLRTAIAAAVTAGLTMTVATSGTTTLVLTSTAAGNWDSVAVGDPNLLSLACDHADPGAATDLAAIQTADNTWYAIVNPWNSRLMALAIAGWAETNKKLFICGFNDGLCATSSLATEVAKTTSADLPTRCNALGYKYTSVWYHPDNGAWLDAAIAGRCLPYAPGSETWAHKTLSGVAAVPMTATHRTNLLAKKANIYETIAGVSITEFGTVSTGEYIDVVRFIDWLVARIGERTFASLASPGNPKIPYTDTGISLIAGGVAATLQDGVNVGGLASYIMSIPKAKDALPADKAARVVKNISFTGVLAGAAHTVQIIGTVSV